MSLRLAEHVLLTDTEDGGVLLDGRTGRYWQLNGTGQMTLRALLDGNDIHDAVDRLVDAHHHVTPLQAATDVKALIQQLRTAGLVTS